MVARPAYLMAVLGALSLACASPEAESTATSTAEDDLVISRFRQEYVFGDLTPGTPSVPITVPGKGTYRAVRTHVTTAHAVDIRVWSDFDPKSGYATPEVVVFDASGTIVAQAKPAASASIIRRLSAELAVGTYYVAFASVDDKSYPFRVAIDAPTELAGSYHVTWRDSASREFTVVNSLKLRTDGRCSVSITTGDIFFGRKTSRAFDGVCTSSDSSLNILADGDPEHKKLDFAVTLGPTQVELVGEGGHLLLEKDTAPACVAKTCAEAASCGHHVDVGCGDVADCGECTGTELLPETLDERASLVLPLKYRFTGDRDVSARECEERYGFSSTSPIAPHGRRDITLNVRLKGTLSKPELVLPENPERYRLPFAFDSKAALSRIDWVFEYWHESAMAFYAGLQGAFEQTTVAGTMKPTRTFVATHYAYTANFAAYDDYKQHHCSVSFLFDGQVKTVFSN